jgi:hypothetical protein
MVMRDIDHNSAKPGHHCRISEDPYEEENILHILCVAAGYFPYHGVQQPPKRIRVTCKYARLLAPESLLFASALLEEVRFEIQRP